MGLFEAKRHFVSIPSAAPVRSIYLDYNATTPIAPAVREAMRPFLEEHFGDPSSHHALGRACHEAIEDARLRVARLLGAVRLEPVQVVVEVQVQVDYRWVSDEVSQFSRVMVKY